MLHKYTDPIFGLGTMVEDLLDPNGPRPPAEPGIYFVSDPMVAIYVGKTKNLSGRIGTLLAAIIGFDARHSGGRTIHKNANLRQRAAMLEIQWLANPPCLNCAEYEVWHETTPLANTKSVTHCKNHFPPLGLAIIGERDD